MKWILRLGLVGVLGLAGWACYDAYRGGYFDLPDLPDDAYPISFQNGLRGIVYDVEATNETYENAPKYFRRLIMAKTDRRYIGVPVDVATWFEDAWSTCRPDIPEAQSYFEESMPEELKARLQGTRFEAICVIELEDQEDIVRGAIYSVPKL